MAAVLFSIAFAAGLLDFTALAWHADSFLGKATACPSPEYNLKSADECIDVRRYQSVLEDGIYRAVSEQRRENGLAPVPFDPGLAGVSRAHSTDMAENGFVSYFTHGDNSSGQGPKSRAYAAGVACGDPEDPFGMIVRENIFQGWTFGAVHTFAGMELSRDYYSAEDLSREIAAAWMGDPDHRQIILGDYSKQGVGVAVTEQGEIFVTQDFC
jgi:uncharacterized protein YkwD